MGRVYKEKKDFHDALKDNQEFCDRLKDMIEEKMKM